MKPFETIDAVAVPIDDRNLDTNQLCPTRFNKIPVNDPDYQRILFNNQRFNDDGSERSDFILNQQPFRDAGIIVADDNFGCGSSRESAVYALLAFGVRCVIAPSFGDIFFSNATKNGLLPVVLDSSICDALRASLHASPGESLIIDLESQVVSSPSGDQHPFDIHTTIKHRLLQGLDDVGVTLEYRDDIAAFEQDHHAAMPWLFSQARS